ncbi:MAG TPA: hypothetical protein VLU38_00485 [Methanomassiliicoccales archaeon]|nr:hypothetical protein [Methanomassiliicoccales archaeon]
MSEAYLKSRIGMSGESDLPAWLMSEELYGMAKAALLNDAVNGDKNRQRQLPKNGFWHLPRRKGVKS